MSLPAVSAFCILPSTLAPGWRWAHFCFLLSVLARWWLWCRFDVALVPHWGGFKVALGWLSVTLPAASAFCILPSPHGGLRLGCISIRNSENGSLHPFASLVPLWYQPGPTLVP